ncbi:MAG TPA: hypothetical protein VH575_32460 [Gemmataceae bacterium]|jgi:hypothetical protein
MTAVGKILVFLNLVFSLVVGAFVIMIFLARVHWVESDKAKSSQIEVLSANVKTYQNEATKAKQDAAALDEKKNGELKKKDEDLRIAHATIDDLNGQLSKEKKNNTQQGALATMAGAETVKRQEDVAMLRKNLETEQEKNNELVKQNADFKNEATIAKIERQSVQDQNNRLEARLQQMAKDMARIRASGGSTALARSNGKNPPPENVEGLVKQTDSSGLMTITVGSDSGLSKGQTLELFRRNLTSPSNSKYLGTVRILEAYPKEAVVQPVGSLRAPPRKGDQVASRILGG